MPVIDEEITEAGLLIQKTADGSTIKKCLTDQCIRKRTGDSTMSRDCSCSDCSTKRLNKADSDDTLDPAAVKILDQELPPEIFSAVMEHFTEEKVEDADHHEEETDPLGEVPEDEEEIGKALAESLYGAEPESDSSTEAILTKSEGRLSRLATPEHYAVAMIESETPDLEKSADVPDSLDRFYAEVES